MDQKSAKIYFKDQWFDVESGDLITTEYSTEVLYADDQEELDNKTQTMLESRKGSIVINKVRHVTEVLSIEGDVKPVKYKMSKEEMMDFILNNWVSIQPDGGIWTRTDGSKVRNKYNVSINDTRMSGMDLEEAIQYYHDNLRKK